MQISNNGIRVINIERGVYRNMADGKQIVSFEGLVYGNKSPTDIDGVFEYDNKAWIVYEVKRKGVQIRYGQKLALERMINDLSATGKYCIAVIAEHEVYDKSKPIPLLNCRVREYKLNNKPWRQPEFEHTGKEVTDGIIRKITKEN